MGVPAAKALLQPSVSFSTVKTAAYFIPYRSTPHNKFKPLHSTHTHNYTHICTKIVAAPVNQSARFWCPNQKLVVWKANCLTDCDEVRTGAHHSRCSRTSGLHVRSALRIVLNLLNLLKLLKPTNQPILHCFWHAP